MAKPKFRVPRGAAFNLASGTWFIPQPHEPRPFFERLLKDPTLQPMVMMPGPNDAYVVISERDGDNVISERVTHPEFEQLMRMRGQAPVEDKDDELDPDTFISGPGPQMGAVVVEVLQPSLAVGERGLVLIPHLSIDSDNVAKEDLGFAPAELRGAIWLWDKLIWPSHNLITEAPSADADFLIAEGVMQRGHVQSMGTLHSKSAMQRSHLDIYQRIDDVEPGRWSLGRGSRGETPDGADQAAALVLNLTEMIPVPAADVPFDDVLAFRSKRRDELLALREYLDDLASSVESAPNEARAWVAAQDKLNRAIQAQLKVADESKLRTVLSSMERSVTVDQLPSAIGAAVIAAWMTGSAAAAGIAAAGQISVNAGVNWKNSAGNSSPLNYMISMRRDFAGRRGSKRSGGGK